MINLPRSYACARCETPPVVDGRLDEPCWDVAPWTENFGDIQGDSRPNPRFRTRAKMLWDDDCLYVGAEMEEPHVNGTLTEKNCVIFHDNDFEVFIDPDGDNHNYYEFEMNALNTIWELTLPKPYRAGGNPVLGTNLEGLRSAVHVAGTLNNPRDTDMGWSVEIAFPWKGLAAYADGVSCPPRAGDQWRINFSRVEWLFDIIDGQYRKIPKAMREEDNWVWSPQGMIDMHRPWHWGVVQFCDAIVPVMADPSIETQQRLMAVYEHMRERVQAGIQPSEVTGFDEFPFDTTGLEVGMGTDGEWYAEIPGIDRTGKRIGCRVDQDQRFTRQV